MDFDLTEEERLIRDTARDFAQKEIAPKAAEIDKNGRWPAEIVAQMSELGFMGVAIPEAYGGAGMTALDRHNIISAVEASLRRLNTDYIDLYQTHWPDHGARYEDALRALDDLVESGKVRIIGCSNETSWGLMKSLSVSEREGLARYETIQNNFSMNNRRFEDELAQVCRQEGVSLIPYSPLAGGVLSGKYNNGGRPDGARFSNYLNMGGRQAAMVKRFVNDKSLLATERFGAIAQEAGMSLVTMATAWSMQHDFVASTIVGATHENQLAEIFAAADLILSDEVMKKINAVSKEILYPMG
jgi:aryl-alcohol dehydrogenase-like predicted oxidoreductase